MYTRTRAHTRARYDACVITGTSIPGQDPALPLSAGEQGLRDRIGCNQEGIGVGGPEGIRSPSYRSAVNVSAAVWAPLPAGDCGES